MDKSPTTEESDQPLKKDQPAIPSEVKSGIMLPLKVSELRWKLGQKGQARAEVPVLRLVRPDHS